MTTSTPTLRDLELAYDAASLAYDRAVNYWAHFCSPESAKACDIAMKAKRDAEDAVTRAKRAAA